jgi:choline dehydrogenase-like flavoprotein
VHVDARQLDNGSLIEGDLCIIGAGAAGITIALEWIGNGKKVLLLEGGGFEYEKPLQELYRGAITGLPYFPLEAARLHYFGGTTNHWAGFCSTLDPIDLEVRDWVPHSGWPISYDDLKPYYARARTLLDLVADEWSSEEWERRDPSLKSLPLAPAVAWTKMWQFSRPTRFGTRYRDALVKAPNVHLYTYANVVELIPNVDATAVDSLRVKTITGKAHRVRARQYVLAASTIQNARLLLASTTRTPAGLGNQHDLVGRYFMEHLEMPSGQLALTGDRMPDMKMYMFEFGRTKGRGEIAVSADMQRANRMLNATVSLTPGTVTGAAKARSTFEAFPPDAMPGFRSPESSDSQSEASTTSRLPSPSAVRAPVRVYDLLTRQEQAPNPASRVTLMRERDELGVPRAQLDWRLTELDRNSFRAFYEVLGRELGRTGLGRVRMNDWVLEHGPKWPASLGGGWHHMGTTRMHSDSTQGVVDAFGRVHGVANLYVAGASVYPTAGCANPTLTLVALSLRTAQHMTRR